MIHLCQLSKLARIPNCSFPVSQERYAIAAKLLFIESRAQTPVGSTTFGQADETSCWANLSQLVTVTSTIPNLAGK